MKGVSVWLWLIASIVIGLLMLTLALQFIKFITEAKEKDLGKENLDELASHINGLCSSRTGDSVQKNVILPDKVSIVYATNDVKFPSNESKTYGINLCMMFSNEIICNYLNCNLEIDTIKNHETIQTILNQFLGNFGTNSFAVKILRTDCGVAVLTEGSASTCTINNTPV